MAMYLPHVSPSLRFNYFFSWVSVTDAQRVLKFYMYSSIFLTVVPAVLYIPALGHVSLTGRASTVTTRLAARHHYNNTSGVTGICLCQYNNKNNTYLMYL